MTGMDRPAGALVVGYALSALGAILFATKGVLIKLIYRYGIDATSLLAVRMALSTPVFVAVGAAEWRRTGAKARPAPLMLAKAAAVGVIGYYVSSWLDFAGLQTLDAQLERLILFTYPFMVILFGRLIFGRALTLHAVAGAGLSYAGLAVMFASDPARLTDGMLTGGALVLTAAMTFALYQLFASELIRQLGPTLFTAVAMSGAGVAVLLHYALSGAQLPATLPRDAWILILMLAVFATVMPSFIMSAGTARIGAQGTAIISSVSPVATIALAITLLGEPFGLPEAMGTLLVMGGIGWFTWVETRRSRAQNQISAGASLRGGPASQQAR